MATSAAARYGLTVLIAAPVVWSVHFLFIYGLNALACARGIGAGWVDAGIVAATFLAGAGLAGMLVPVIGHARRGDEAATPFLNHVALITGIVVGLALIWNMLPVLLVPSCPTPATL